MNIISTLLLTTFISVNGNIQEVPIDSPEAIAYETESETDIGNPDYWENLEKPDIVRGTYENEYMVESSDSVSDSDLLPVPEAETPEVVFADDTQVVKLLEDTIDLLAENSSSVTGTLNTTILNLMDRIVDDYPSYYTYAGFRTSNDDSYASTLYIAKKAMKNGNTITFSDDCIKIQFSRQTYNNNMSSYIYYEVTESPNATVNVNNHTIVYTNVLDGYPSLGTKSTIPEYYIWIVVFVILATVIIKRRKSND